MLHSDTGNFVKKVDKIINKNSNLQIDDKANIIAKLKNVINVIDEQKSGLSWLLQYFKKLVDKYKELKAGNLIKELQNKEL